MTERIDRIRQERAAAGKEPTIQTPSVYALLAACLDAAANNAPTTKD